MLLVARGYYQRMECLNVTSSAERIVVYTCITNAYDPLPTVRDRWEGCDYVCFTDNPYLRSTVWEMRLLTDGAYTRIDPHRRSRLPKILAHRFLLEYSTSVWIDSNATPHIDLSSIARQELSQRSAVFFAHPERDCIYKEAEACIRLGKGDPATIRRQIEEYRRVGMPEKAGLFACTILIRRHRDPAVIRLMESWWQELLRHSVRDQISLPFVAWQAGFPLHRIPIETPSGPAYERRHHYVQRREMQKRARIKESEVAVLSHPKSGRTWLRHFLANYLKELGRDNVDPEFGPNSLDGRGIVFDHEFMEIYQDCTEPPRLLHGKVLHSKRVVLLVRDPRSVVVSYYYHKRLREKLPVGGVVDFCRSPMYGIERQASFVNLLLDFKEQRERDTLLLRYEDLMTDHIRYFGQFVRFVLSEEPIPEVLTTAVRSSGFRAMQDAEIELSSRGVAADAVNRLGVASWDGDINALKVRRGDPTEARQVLVGGMWQELSHLPQTNKLLRRLGYVDARSDALGMDPAPSLQTL